MQPLEAGEPLSIGAYRLLGRLGAGGMGRVYLGRSAGGRTVAVKVVHPHFALDEQFRARFRREVEAARRIGAQWTAPVLDADPDAPVPWVATGYVAGPPLSAAVTEHGPLPEHAVRVLGAGLGEALAAVHERGLIHRDVKPSNVLLALDGPRLIDFGIARAIDATASLTSTGVSVGSPGYMAPEQIRGTDLSGAADIFSLGAVLAYAATGSAPFLGDSSAVLLYKVVHEEPELGELEGPLRDTIAACLAKDPARRPTPAELARRLLPGGAAAAVAAGWLPGPLVRQVSRSAVALLDLEPQEAPDRSGPVPFSNPSFGAFASGGPGGTDGPGAGESPAHAAGGYGSYAPGGPAAGGPAAGGGVYGSFGPPQPQAAGAGGLPGQRTGGRGLTLGATGGAGRRQVSCTLAVAVAGALAAVTVGSAFLLDLMPGSGGRTGNVGQGEARPTPSKPSEPGAGSGTRRPTTSPGGAAELPDAFVGTWRGPLDERSGGESEGTLTAVFEKGRTGTDVLRLTTLLSPEVGITCHSVATLTSASADELELRERPDPDRPSRVVFCPAEPADLHVTLAADGTLRFRSDGKVMGSPYGTLTRSGG